MARLRTDRAHGKIQEMVEKEISTISMGKMSSFLTNEIEEEIDFCWDLINLVHNCQTLTERKQGKLSWRPWIRYANDTLRNHILNLEQTKIRIREMGNV